MGAYRQPMERSPSAQGQIAKFTKLGIALVDNYR